MFLKLWKCCKLIISLIDQVKNGYIREDRIESCIYSSNAINNKIVAMKNVHSCIYMLRDLQIWMTNYLLLQIQLRKVQIS